MPTDVCGDDRFSPGVTERTTLNRQTDLDSHGEVLWECLSVREYSSVTCLLDWRSILRFIALVGFAGISGYGRPSLLFEDADLASGL